MTAYTQDYNVLLKQRPLDISLYPVVVGLNQLWMILLQPTKKASQGGTFFSGTLAQPLGRPFVPILGEIFWVKEGQWNRQPASVPSRLTPSCIVQVLPSHPGASPPSSGTGSTSVTPCQ